MEQNLGDRMRGGSHRDVAMWGLSQRSMVDVVFNGAESIVTRARVGVDSGRGTRSLVGKEQRRGLRFTLPE